MGFDSDDPPFFMAKQIVPTRFLIMSHPKCFISIETVDKLSTNRSIYEWLVFIFHSSKAILYVNCKC